MITTEKELAEAIKNNEDTLEIEGDLIKKVLKIKATGKVAWVVAIGAISVAVVSILATGGTSAPVSGAMATGAVAVLGISTTASAISIAVAAGGVGVLNRLREYKIIETKHDRLILKKQ